MEEQLNVGKKYVLGGYVETISLLLKPLYKKQPW